MSNGDSPESRDATRDRGTTPAEKGTTPPDKGTSRSPVRVAAPPDAGLGLPGGVWDPYDISDRVIVPDQLASKSSRYWQITESEFLQQLSMELADRINRDVRDAGVTPNEIELLLREGRTAILGPDQLWHPIDPWLRERLGLALGASPSDYYARVVALLDARSFMALPRMAKAVERLPEDQLQARHSDEGDSEIDMSRVATVPAGAGAAAAGVIAPPAGAIPPSAKDGRDVHLLIQQHYLLTHHRHTVMMERWVVWPGGGGAIQHVGKGHTGFDELARVRFALMTKRGLTKLPDILDITMREVYEIKPASQASKGYVQLYDNYLKPLSVAGLTYRPGETWRALPVYPLGPKFVVVAQTPGLILYWIVPVGGTRIPIPKWLPVAALAVGLVVTLFTPVPGDEAASAAALVRALAAI